MTEQENREARENVRGQAERLRWLIFIRWTAVFGIAASSLMTEAAGYSLLVGPPWLLVPFVLGYNFFFLWWLRWAQRQQMPPGQAERILRWQGYLQAVCDMIAMILLVYLDGGIEYPLYYAPLLAVMLSSVLLPRAGVFLQANVGAILFAVMAVGEYKGWLPHVNFLQEPYRHNLYLEWRPVLGTVLSMAAMLNLTAYLMSSLGQRLNQAEVGTRRLLGQLRLQVGEAATRLAGQTVGIQMAAQEVNQVAEQIAATVQQIAQGAGEQAGQLERLSHNLEGLADAGRRVAEGAQETHAAAGQAVTTADRGREAAREAEARMEEFARVFAQAQGALGGLARRSEEIAEVAGAIDRFAERTDLLALNAGIEAARAGEHGRGFAVVAGEVKKLAASSSASAEQVGELVGQVQAEIASVVRSVEASLERVRSGQEAIGILQDVLEVMGGVIVRTDELAGVMEELSRQQREAHGEIVRAAEEIASAAEETAAGAEETASAVEEQVASFAEFSQTAQDLAGLAAQLDQAVAGLTSEEGI